MNNLQALYDSIISIDRIVLARRIFYEFGSRGIQMPEYFFHIFSRYCLRVTEFDDWTEVPPEPPEYMGGIEGLRYVDLLQILKKRTYHDWKPLVDILTRSVLPVVTVLGNGNFKVSLAQLVGEAKLVNAVSEPFLNGKDYFPKLYKKLQENIRDVGCLPEEYKGKNMVWTYLKDTPLFDLVNIIAPIDIPFDLYFEHTQIVAGSGAGKSQYLAQFTLEQIRNPEQPSIILVDSQDSLIPQVRRLTEIQDRVTYIDPRNPPSINLFDGGGAFDTYRYLFSTILDMELTGKQETFFKFIVRLLQEVPRATLKDLVDLTVSTEKYNQYIERLPEPHRQFFENDYQQTYKDTRAQVRTRLQGILADETLFQFLWGSSTELDIQDIISNGGVLLVDTSRDALGEASSMFGKVFIFLIMKAVYGRQDRHPLFLVVDEASEYFSSTIDTMLNQMRKFRCGCVFAHQNLNQASPELRASLASSTSIKMCSQVSVPDARIFAQEMRTTPEFITNQPRLRFALYARGVTTSAVSIEVTPGILERQETTYIPKAPRRVAPSPVEEHDAPVEQGIDAVDDSPSETL